ncbi:MAG TPA: hypothetical protein VF211_16575 [Burkholderiales bacterium]
MRALLFAACLALAAPAPAQDALSLVLESAPRALGLAGSAENLASLLAGLTRGAPVRLVAAGPAGFRRVVAFAPPGRLTAEQTVALLQQVARDFDLAGISRATPEQLAAALGASGVRSFLEPDPRRPTPEEQALASLPPDVRGALAGLAPREALRTAELADQQLIALGTPYASSARRSDMVRRLRYGTGYVAASAGDTPFPPLSPLVAAPPPR